VEAGNRPPCAAMQGTSPMLHALWQQFDSLVLRDGVLYRLFYNNNGLVVHLQLVLPAVMKVPFLELIHADAGGHLKLRKCLPHVARRAWWLSWRKRCRIVY